MPAAETPLPDQGEPTMVICRGDLPHLTRLQWAHIDRSSPPGQRETDSAEDHSAPLLRGLPDRTPQIGPTQSGPTQTRLPTGMDL